MMTTTKTQVKVNKENTISIIDWTEDNAVDYDFEIAHIQNGVITYKHTNNDVLLISGDEMDCNEAVQELIADIIAEEITAGDSVSRAEDAQIVVESFTYNIWIAVQVYNSKVTYSISTIRPEADNGEMDDKNNLERKTFKGMMNAVKRFDK